MIEFFKGLFAPVPYAEFTPLQMMVSVMIGVILAAIVCSIATACAKAIFRAITKSTAKRKAKRKRSDIICHNCGVSLARCSCPSNKYLSLNKRYARWKREERMAIANDKAAAKAIRIQKKIERLQNSGK